MLLLEDKHPNLTTTITNSVFTNDVADFKGPPFWIEGMNHPCVGATFRNVTLIDKVQPSGSTPNVHFTGDVRNMAGEIVVDSPNCVKEEAPPGNSVLITCKQQQQSEK